MSLVRPHRHRGKSKGPLDDADAVKLTKLLAKCRTPFGTLDKELAIRKLRNFRLASGGTLNDFFLFNTPQEALNRFFSLRLSKLLGNVLVEYKDLDGEIHTTRAYHKVTVQAGVPGAHGYVHVSRVLGDPQLEQQVVSRYAVNRTTWQNLHKHIHALIKLAQACRQQGRRSA